MLNFPATHMFNLYVHIRHYVHKTSLSSLQVLHSDDISYAMHATLDRQLQC